MFITFEGIDACGKTTQLKLLAEALNRKGLDVLTTRQPGGTEIGGMIRNILLDPRNTRLIPTSEVLLYLADRLQHLAEMIEPALEKGQIVLCDRYHDATIAYQGGGRQLDLSWLKLLEENAIRKPDLTLWFDISVFESQKRLEKRNELQGIQHCRLERENADFFQRVRTAYDRLSRTQSRRFVKIEAERDIPTIHQEVVSIVMKNLA